MHESPSTFSWKHMHVIKELLRICVSQFTPEQVHVLVTSDFSGSRDFLC